MTANLLPNSSTLELSLESLSQQDVDLAIKVREALNGDGESLSTVLKQVDQIRVGLHQRIHLNPFDQPETKPVSPKESALFDAVNALTRILGEAVRARTPIRRDGGGSGWAIYVG